MNTATNTNIHPITTMAFYTPKMPKDLGFVPLDCQNVAEGMYEIDPFGNVRSLHTNRLMSTFFDSYGYKRIRLKTVDESEKNFYVHRLVAMMFIENPDPAVYTEVNHINKNKLKNDYTNLEWCTSEENKRHAKMN